ncbi:MAG: DUF655 domain-containing protein, partial [Elusimicrobia bacterium]|nr:DUF655 domain-containing protein [Elusimicrobiota bacterium]
MDVKVKLMDSEAGKFGIAKNRARRFWETKDSCPIPALVKPPSQRSQVYETILDIKATILGGKPMTYVNFAIEEDTIPALKSWLKGIDPALEVEVMKKEGAAPVIFIYDRIAMLRAMSERNGMWKDPKDHEFNMDDFPVIGPRIDYMQRISGSGMGLQKAVEVLSPYKVPVPGEEVDQAANREMREKYREIIETPEYMTPSEMLVTERARAHGFFSRNWPRMAQGITAIAFITAIGLAIFKVGLVYVLVSSGAGVLAIIALVVAGLIKVRKLQQEKAVSFDDRRKANLSILASVAADKFAESGIEFSEKLFDTYLLEKNIAGEMINDRWAESIIQEMLDNRKANIDFIMKTFQPVGEQGPDSIDEGNIKIIEDYIKGSSELSVSVCIKPLTRTQAQAVLDDVIDSLQEREKPEGAVTQLFVGIVDINTASLEELQALPGIGARNASRIIEVRKQSPIKSLEDLQSRVGGISGKAVSEIKTLSANSVLRTRRDQLLNIMTRFRTPAIRRAFAEFIHANPSPTYEQLVEAKNSIEGFGMMTLNDLAGLYGLEAPSVELAAEPGEAIEEGMTDLQLRDILAGLLSPAIQDFLIYVSNNPADERDITVEPVRIGNRVVFEGGKYNDRRRAAIDILKAVQNEIGTVREDQYTRKVRIKGLPVAVSVEDFIKLSRKTIEKLQEAGFEVEDELAGAVERQVMVLQRLSEEAAQAETAVAADPAIEASNVAAVEQALQEVPGWTMDAASFVRENFDNTKDIAAEYGQETVRRAVIEAMIEDILPKANPRIKPDSPEMMSVIELIADNPGLDYRSLYGRLTAISGVGDKTAQAVIDMLGVTEAAETPVQSVEETGEKPAGETVVETAMTEMPEIPSGGEQETAEPAAEDKEIVLTPEFEPVVTEPEAGEKAVQPETGKQVAEKRKATAEDIAALAAYLEKVEKKGQFTVTYIYNTRTGEIRFPEKATNVPELREGEVPVGMILTLDTSQSKYNITPLGDVELPVEFTEVPVVTPAEALIKEVAEVSPEVSAAQTAALAAIEAELDRIAEHEGYIDGIGGQVSPEILRIQTQLEELKGEDEITRLQANLERLRAELDTLLEQVTEAAGVQEQPAEKEITLELEDATLPEAEPQPDAAELARQALADAVAQINAAYGISLDPASRSLTGMDPQVLLAGAEKLAAA